MYKYKNIIDRKVIFNAGASAENPSMKKFYEVMPGQTVEVPVLLTRADGLELVEEEKEQKKKK